MDFPTLEFEESTSKENSNKQLSTGANETECKHMLNHKHLDKVNSHNFAEH